MNDGTDTAFYLACGYRVLAIEADPLLFAAAQKRFQSEIASNRLILLNVAIAEKVTTADFWVNDTMPGLSTFNRELMQRSGSAYRAIQVQCQPLNNVLDEYGVPYYLKVDIEGYDIVCCNQLSPGTCPQYVSVELTDAAMGDRLFNRLRSLGYDRFKIINQRHLLPIDHKEIQSHRRFMWFLYRVANYRKNNRALPLRAVRAGAAQLLNLATRLGLWGPAAFRSRRLPSWDFSSGLSSGTFGTDLPGEWHSYEEIMPLWKDELAFCASVRQESWHDLHATFSKSDAARV